MSELPSSPIQASPQEPEDPYVTAMEQAEKRRKRLLVSLGLMVFAGLGFAMIQSMQTVSRMNQDLPGVFASKQVLSAKLTPKQVLVYPPKPPTPTEFISSRTASVREGAGVVAELGDPKVAIPVFPQEP